MTDAAPSSGCSRVRSATCAKCVAATPQALQHVARAAVGAEGSHPLAEPGDPLVQRAQRTVGIEREDDDVRLHEAHRRAEARGGPREGERRRVVAAWEGVLPMPL